MKNLSSIVSAINRETMAFFEKSFTRFGLTRGTTPIILAVFEEEGINQKELAEKLHMDKANITRALDKLVQLRYIEKRKNWHDSRITNIYSTELGQNIKKELDEVMNQWEEKLFSEFRTEDREPIRKLLSKIEENACTFLHK